MLNLRAEGRVLRIGHKGAAALEPENTLRSLERAVELGVDLVEFDVLDLEDGTLVLAHSDDLREVSHGAAEGPVRSRSLEELRAVAPDLPTLDEALAFLARRAPQTGVQVDVKWHGYEAGVAEALRRHELVERAVVSSFHPSSLQAFARLEPGLARGLTYPWDRRGVTGRQFLAPALRAGLAALRLSLPLRIERLLAQAEATVAMLHHSVVSRPVVARCHSLGVPVLTWTVDDPAVLESVVRAGVDGVTTNDPRIFVSTLRA